MTIATIRPVYQNMTIDLSGFSEPIDNEEYENEIAAMKKSRGAPDYAAIFVSVFAPANRAAN